MNTSDQTYKAYSFAVHKTIYLALEETFKSFNIPYYLIGANARDVQLYKAGKKPNRGTADIDFAVMLPDMESYTSLKDELKKKGFEDAHGNEPYRLYHANKETVIDLLPYGEIAQNNTVIFTERHVELSTVGMKEVGTETELFDHPEGFSIPVSPAHGIVILKLIAWNENPGRTKDLSDIQALMDAAWELYESELFTTDSQYSDLFDVDDFDKYLAAIHIMGRKMQAVLSQSDDLSKLITDVLQRELDRESGPISQQIVSGTTKTIESTKKVFEALLKGINDK